MNSHLRTLTAKNGKVPLRSPALLLVMAGPDQGARFELASGSALIGSQEGCDWVLTDKTISRQHLRLALTPEGLRVEDLGSRNGTWVNGVPVREASIVLGARVRMGATELQVFALHDSDAQSPQGDEYWGLLCRSRAMQQLVALICRAARTDATVLLQGESGSGKEAVAKALHAASGRPGPWVAVSCGALSGELISSELFGHLRGSFTGAIADKVGAVERAEGGTLFLDEVGELDKSIQPALLRLLEGKEIQPVGSAAWKKVDVRVVAATHHDLARLVDRRTFREDLYYRLAVLTLPVPPLRERLQDVPLLAQRLLSEEGLSLDLGDAALEQLCTYDWPGNVRELRNVLIRAVTLEQPINPGEAQDRIQEGFLQVSNLPLNYREARAAMLARFEREYLVHLVAKSRNNVSQAARHADIARGSLYRLLKRHQLV